MTEPPGGIGPPEAAAPLVAWEAPRPAAGPAPGVEFAAHGPRLVAYLLDFIVIVLALLAMSVALVVVGSVALDTDMFGPSVVRGSPASMILLWIWALALLVIVFGHFPFFWARGGQTPGMKPFRLWIVRDQDGTRISTRTAVLRWIGMYCVSSTQFYLGFIWVFIDRRRRSWHDLIAGTVVIHRIGGNAQ